MEFGEWEICSMIRILYEHDSILSLYMGIKVAWAYPEVNIWILYHIVNVVSVDAEYIYSACFVQIQLRSSVHPGLPQY